MRAARRAHAQKKSLVFFQVGTSATGQVMIRSHTGALAGDTEILRAFLRRCGIVQADSYDQFVETIELLANAPFDDDAWRRGRAGVGQRRLGGGRRRLPRRRGHARWRRLTPRPAKSCARSCRSSAAPTNPIDATGVVYDDPALLPALFEAIFAQPGRPIIAATVNVAPVDRLRRIAGAIADAARTSGRTIVAYQSSPLGPLDDGDRAHAACGQRPAPARHPECHGRAEATQAAARFRAECREHAVRRCEACRIALTIRCRRISSRRKRRSWQPASRWWRPRLRPRRRRRSRSCAGSASRSRSRRKRRGFCTRATSAA